MLNVAYFILLPLFEFYNNNNNNNIIFIIQGPILDHTRTHLQKSLGDDNVLVVKFAEDKSARNSKTSPQEAVDLYGKFGRDGIRVGLRLYRFFGNPITC